MKRLNLLFIILLLQSVSGFSQKNVTLDEGVTYVSQEMFSDIANWYATKSKKGKTPLYSYLESKNHQSTEINKLKSTNSGTRSAYDPDCNCQVISPNATHAMSPSITTPPEVDEHAGTNWRWNYISQGVGAARSQYLDTWRRRTKQVASFSNLNGNSTNIDLLYFCINNQNMPADCGCDKKMNLKMSYKANLRTFTNAKAGTWGITSKGAQARAEDIVFFYEMDYESTNANLIDSTNLLTMSQNSITTACAQGYDVGAIFNSISDILSLIEGAFGDGGLDTLSGDISSLGENLGNVQYQSGTCGVRTGTNGATYDGLLILKNGIRKTIRLTSGGNVFGRGWGARSYADAEVHSDYALSVAFQPGATEIACCIPASGVINIGKGSQDSPRPMGDLYTNAFVNIDTWDVTTEGWNYSDAVNETNNTTAGIINKNTITSLRTEKLTSVNDDCRCWHLQNVSVINPNVCLPSGEAWMNNTTGRSLQYTWYNSDNQAIGGGQSKELEPGSYSVEIEDPELGCSLFKSFSVQAKTIYDLPWGQWLPFAFYQNTTGATGDPTAAEQIFISYENKKSIVNKTAHSAGIKLPYAPEMGLYAYMYFDFEILYKGQWILLEEEIEQTEIEYKWYNSDGELISTEDHMNFTAFGDYTLQLRINGCLLPVIPISVGKHIKGKIKGDPISSNRAWEGIDLSTSSIYPNPASETLNLKFSFDEDIMGTIQLISVNGQIVLDQSFTTSELQSLDISHLNNGIYFYKISSTQHGAHMGKFSVVKGQ
ncbi:MAG: T9SS type A sorting domain-containing protein [Bacteroidota bacterium]